jgi:putative PIN family toxin of toxin-antitoxin system
MKYYAVLDTNVLVSALLKTTSTPGYVAAETLHGDIIPVLNDEILAEYEDVLNRSKFRFDKSIVQVFLDDLKKRALYSDCAIVDDELPDKKDIVFYAVIMKAREDKDAYLVTGNLKHFPVRTYVVTPREMLDIVAAGK